LKGAVYPQHHILQDLGMDFAIFWHGLLDLWQLCFLVKVAEGDTAHPPGFASLPKGGVVDVATEHEDTIKHPLLLESGLEFILIGFLDTLLFHLKLFCLIATKAATMSAFPVLPDHSAFPIGKARDLSRFMQAGAKPPAERFPEEQESHGPDLVSWTQT
jgi:hypothetical protein